MFRKRNHVYHVVWRCTVVNTRLAGQRRLNGDLRRLGVADFADMILSGSWRRIERSPRAKVSPFFVHRNLRDAAQLIFDWVSMVMILSSSVLISVDRGVERSRFGRCGRPVTAPCVRLFNIARNLRRSSCQNQPRPV